MPGHAFDVSNRHLIFNFFNNNSVILPEFVIFIVLFVFVNDDKWKVNLTDQLNHNLGNKLLIISFSQVYFETGNMPCYSSLQAQYILLFILVTLPPVLFHLTAKVTTKLLLG